MFKPSIVFDMSSLENKNGLHFIQKTSFSVDNPDFTRGLHKQIFENTNVDFVQKCDFIAFYNVVRKRIYIIKNRYNNVTGVFDYVI